MLLKQKNQARRLNFLSYDWLQQIINQSDDRKLARSKILIYINTQKIISK